MPSAVIVTGPSEVTAFEKSMAPLTVISAASVTSVSADRLPAVTAPLNFTLPSPLVLSGKAFVLTVCLNSIA